MKLVHMSDTHITGAGVTIGGRDPRINFDRALAEILRDHGDAELLVITGDLSDRGDRDDYAWLKSRLAGFPLPVRLCIGNHDRRATFLSVFPDYHGPGGFVQGVHDTSAGRCLFLDTAETGTHAGHFCKARQQWLEARLSEHPGPFLLFMHHNPMPIHLEPWDRIGLLGDGAFRKIAGRHRDKIRHIFFGHCHLPLAGSVGGVPVSSLRGTNHAGYPNFAEQTFASAADLPEAYGVVFVGDDYVTVHMVEFGYAGVMWDENSDEYTNRKPEALLR